MADAKTVKRVAVTGAAGQIGYALLPRIAAGEIFGPDQPVRIQCLEIPPAMDAVRGVGMEMLDAAFPLLAGFTASDDPREAFEGADLALLVGSKPRSKGMERKDLIRENGPIFTGQGNALSDVASPDCRVIVVGNPCNTNCLIAQHNAPKLEPRNFSAMTQLDHNRAVAQLADKAGRHNTDVAGVIIWGNHSNKQYPDYQVIHATIGREGRPARRDRPRDEPRGLAGQGERGASSRSDARARPCRNAARRSSTCSGRSSIAVRAGGAMSSKIVHSPRGRAAGSPRSSSSPSERVLQLVPAVHRQLPGLDRPLVVLPPTRR